MVYVALLGVESTKQLVRLYTKTREAQFYERMALEDILTGAKNRAAYDRDLSRYLSSPEAAGLRLVVLDLNGLKHTSGQILLNRADQSMYMNKRFIESQYVYGHS